MSKNERIRRDAIVSCAVSCELALKFEQDEFQRGDLAEAAYWAHRAECWSDSAFGWAAMGFGA